jgi:competence protein ComGC
MLKNKDGSYNKLSLSILTLIVIIGIGLIILTFIPDINNNTNDINTTIISLVVIIGVGITSYKFSKIVLKPWIRSWLQTSLVNNKNLLTQPVIKKDTTLSNEINDIKTKLSDKNKPDIIELALNEIKKILPILFPIGLIYLTFIYILQPVLESITQAVPTNPAFQEPATSVVETINATMGILPILILVPTTIFIIIMMMKVIRTDDYRY